MFLRTWQPSLKHLQKELVILFALMWPILFTQIAQAGVGFIDSLMAGQYSAEDLAAVAVGAGIWLPCLLMVNGTMVATTALIAEAKGAKKLIDTPIITQRALWTGLLVGLVGMWVLHQAHFVFGPLQVPKELHAKTLQYLKGVQWSMPAAGMYVALRGYTEGLGKPKPVMVVSLSGLALTAPINWLFIYGVGDWQGFGGVGCGYGTSVVFWLMTFALGSYLYISKHYQQDRLFQKFYWPSLKWLNHFLTIGLPIGIAVFFEASLFCIAALILSPLGSKAIAAHQIALSITSVLFMVPLSMAFALTIQMGQLYGAKAWHELRYVARTGFVMATFLACINIAVVLLFKQQLINQFTQDTQVIQFASGLLLCAAAYQIFDAWQVSASAMLRGLQDTRSIMWITLISYWAIALPVGTWLARYTSWGPVGFWLGLVLGLAIAAFLLTSRLYYRLDHIK